MYKTVNLRVRLMVDEERYRDRYLVTDGVDGLAEAVWVYVRNLIDDSPAVRFDAIVGSGVEVADRQPLPDFPAGQHQLSKVTEDEEEE